MLRLINLYNSNVRHDSSIGIVLLQYIILPQLNKTKISHLWILKNLKKSFSTSWSLLSSCFFTLLFRRAAVPPKHHTPFHTVWIQLQNLFCETVKAGWTRSREHCMVCGVFFYLFFPQKCGSPSSLSLDWKYFCFDFSLVISKRSSSGLKHWRFLLP